MGINLKIYKIRWIRLNKKVVFLQTQNAEVAQSVEH